MNKKSKRKLSTAFVSLMLIFAFAGCLKNNSDEKEYLSYNNQTVSDEDTDIKNINSIKNIGSDISINEKQNTFIKPDIKRYSCYLESWKRKEKYNRLHYLVYLYDNEQHRIAEIYDHSTFDSSSFIGASDKTVPYTDVYDPLFSPEENCYVVMFGTEQHILGEYKMFLPEDSPEFDINTKSEIIAGKCYTQEEFDNFTDYELLYSINLHERAVQIYGKNKYHHSVIKNRKEPQFYQNEKLFVLRDAEGTFLDSFGAYLFAGANYENSYISDESFCIDLFYFPDFPEMANHQLVYIDRNSDMFTFFDSNMFDEIMLNRDYFVFKNYILMAPLFWSDTLKSSGILKFDIETKIVTGYKGHYLNYIEPYRPELNGDMKLYYKYIDFLPINDPTFLSCFEYENDWYVITETEIVKVEEEPAHGARKRLSDFWVK